jgi:hypothetical protein
MTPKFTTAKLFYELNQFFPLHVWPTAIQFCRQMSVIRKESNCVIITARDKMKLRKEEQNSQCKEIETQTFTQIWPSSLIRKVKTWSEESAAHSNAGGRTSVAMSV